MLFQTRHPRSFRLIINRLFFRKKPYNLTRYSCICTSQALLDNSKVKVLAFFIDIPYNIHRYRKESLYEIFFTVTDMPLRVFLLVRT